METEIRRLKHTLYSLQDRKKKEKEEEDNVTKTASWCIYSTIRTGQLLLCGPLPVSIEPGDYTAINNTVMFLSGTARDGIDSACGKNSQFASWCIYSTVRTCHSNTPCLNRAR